MSGWLPRLAFPPPSPNEVNLYELCENEDWDGTLALFADPTFQKQARQKIYVFDEDDITPFHLALYHKCPLAVATAFLEGDAVRRACLCAPLKSKATRVLSLMGFEERYYCFN